MSPGKLAAQAGHAYLDSYLRACDLRPRDAAEYVTDHHGTKVCLSSENLSWLLYAKEQAEDAGIPFALITDSGHILPPHFDGSPVITALGIGPARRSEISHITNRFKLA